MAPVEPWERVLVSVDFFDSVHGKASCIDCHGGQQSEDKDTAHTGMVASPDADAGKLCGGCHEDNTAEFDASMHATQGGFWTVLNARSTPENHPALETAFNNHCASCHTTCGDCHISQPDVVGGGLLNGHVFEKTPPMTRTCIACHGTRVGLEYQGKNSDNPGDVHYMKGQMECVSCHPGADMHAATDAEAPYRYAGAEKPSCTDCHNTFGTADDPVLQHAQHGDKLSCQVCHSVEYTSCDGCHVAISEKTGNPFFVTEATYMSFYIGKNPRQDENRPYEYVVLRHVPASPTGFQYYGEDLQPNFNSLPTWAYTTPHNIQRNTPQNAKCNNCHGNADLYLTADKVKESELEANLPVIVDQVPGALPAD